MDSSRPVDAPQTGLPELSLDQLRSERARARRALELAHLRSGHAADGAARVSALTAQVRELTDELIRRYADDLSLVDSLLDPAYPHGVGSKPAPTRGGAVR